MLAGLAAAVSLATYYLTSERGLGTRDPLSLAAWTFTAAAVFWSVLQPWWSFPWADLTRAVALPGPLPDADVAGVAPGRLGRRARDRRAVRADPARARARSARPAPGCSAWPSRCSPALVAWVVLGEALSPVQLLGGAVVLTGIVLAETARKAHPPSGALPEGVAP